MGFLDLFRPKWKHSDAEVRAEAVRALDAGDAALLARVVKADSDAKVRRIALKKITDPVLLAEVAENDPDEGLRKDAADKAEALRLQVALSDGEEADCMAALEQLTEPRSRAEVAKKAVHEAVRKAALARMLDKKALADVAKKADDPHVRQQALDRIDDPTVLRDVAIADAVKEVALFAVERLGDEKALEQVVQKTRLKTVKNAAREKLAALREAQRPKDSAGPPEAKRRSRQALICRTAEEAAASDDWDHAEKAIEHVKSEWAALGVAPGDEPLRKRLDRALSRYELRREEHLVRQRAQAALEERRAREAAAAEAERAVKAEARAGAVVEDAALRAVVDEAAREEQERRQAERQRRAEEKAQREAERAQKDAARAAEAQDNLARLTEVTERLESLFESTDLKLTEAALKSAQDLQRSLKNLPRETRDEAQARYQAAREKLLIKAKELRDAEQWKRWAAVPRLEALCVKMEALVAVEETANLDRDLRALQAEWKTAGPAPKDKQEALWQRFKNASDQVYARVKGQRVEQREERGKNLELKEALCQKVEALAQIPDGEMSWKETSETVKKLQEEWKAIGPVARAQSEAVWKRFRGACDAFFERRKVHWQELDADREANLKKLEELCERAEALAGSSDWKNTAERLKALQADWKEVGPAPKDKSEAAWKRFRAACDQFFERRKAAFAEADEERQANLKKKELLCEKVEALRDAEDHEAAMAEAKALQAEWKSIGPVPKEQGDEIWARFRKACDQIFKPETRLDEAALARANEESARFAFRPLADKLAAVTTAAAPAATTAAAPAVTTAAAPAAAPVTTAVALRPVPAPAPSPAPEAAPAPSPAPEAAPHPQAAPDPAPEPAPSPDAFADVSSGWDDLLSDVENKPK